MNDNTFIFNIASGTRGSKKPESLTSSQLVLCTNKKKIKLLNSEGNLRQYLKKKIGDIKTKLGGKHLWKTIKFLQSRMKGERHRLSPLSL
jgi:hypothetical protein